MSVISREGAPHLFPEIELYVNLTVVSNGMFTSGQNITVGTLVKLTDPRVDACVLRARRSGIGSQGPNKTLFIRQ